MPRHLLPLTHCSHFAGDHLTFLPRRDGLITFLILTFVINAFVDLVRFARPIFSRGDAIELTEAEQKLLGVKPSDAAFKLAKAPAPSTPPRTFVGISSRCLTSAINVLI